MFNAGDPAAVAEVHERGAVFVPEPGFPLTGPQAQAADVRFMALGLPITVRPRHVHAAAGASVIKDAFDSAGCEGCGPSSA